MGLFIGIVGVVALLGLDVAGDADAVLGAGAVLLSAFGYGAAALLYKRRFSDARPLGVVTVALGVSAAAFAVPAAADLPARMPSPGVLMALATLGVVNTGVAFWLFYSLIASAGAARASVITYVMPAVAVVLGILPLSEPFTAGTALGLALILGGTALSTAREERRAASRRRRPAVADAPSGRG